MKNFFKKIAIALILIASFGTVAYGATVLTVPQGGSGAGTLTGIIRGNGTAPFTAITDGTNGQALVTNGAGVYSFATVSGGGGTPSLPLTSIQYNTAGAFDGDALFIRNAVSNYTDILKDFSASEQGGFRITPDVSGGNLPNAVPGSFAVSEDTVKNLYALSGVGDVGGILGFPPGIATNVATMTVYNPVTSDVAISNNWYYDGSQGGQAGFRHETDVKNGLVNSGLNADDGGFGAYSENTATGDISSIALSQTQSTIRVANNFTGYDGGFFAGQVGIQMFIKPVFTATKDWTLTMNDGITTDTSSLSFGNITDGDYYFIADPQGLNYQLGDCNDAFGKSCFQMNDSTLSTTLETTNLDVHSQNTLNAPLIYINSNVKHTRLGYNAGGNSSLLAGAENVYVGWEAGFGSGVGSLAQGNVAVGFRAGYTLATTGDENTLIGWMTGDSLTTGQNNTLVGARAGSDLTTQSDNALFGGITGGVLTGSQNAFFGTNTGGVSTTANQNAFFGTNAGLDNISGDNNIYVGYFSGDNGVSGGSNIIIGSEGGFDSSRNSSIGIGRSVQITADNQLKFGSGAHPILEGFLGDYTDANNGVAITFSNSARTVSLGHLFGAGNNTKFRLNDTTGQEFAIIDAANLTQINSARILLNGSQQIKRTAVANTNYTIDPGDYLVSMESLSAPRTVTVPDASTAFAGRTYIIKDADCLAGTHNITLDPAGTDTIDNASTLVMTVNCQSITVTSDGGTNWEVI